MAFLQRSLISSFSRYLAPKPRLSPPKLLQHSFSPSSFTHLTSSPLSQPIKPTRFLSAVSRTLLQPHSHPHQRHQWKNYSSRREPRTYHEKQAEKNKQLSLYLIALIIAVGGASYAAVPLYRIFCQATGFGGTVKTDQKGSKSLKDVEINENKVRSIEVEFSGDTSRQIHWKFEPLQSKVSMIPGESVLAFYKATNLSSEPIIGVASYNVTPAKAGLYFRKIQCFCFEDQKLEAGEEVDMPVLFYIDPEILNDPKMSDVTNITLSYTFFRASEDVSY